MGENGSATEPEPTLVMLIRLPSTCRTQVCRRLRPLNAGHRFGLGYWPFFSHHLLSCDFLQPLQAQYRLTNMYVHKHRHACTCSYKLSFIHQSLVINTSEVCKSYTLLQWWVHGTYNHTNSHHGTCVCMFKETETLSVIVDQHHFAILLSKWTDVVAEHSNYAAWCTCLALRLLQSQLGLGTTAKCVNAPIPTTEA